MGFPEKTNPNATPESVKNWALYGSMVGLGLFVIEIALDHWLFRSYWFLIAPAMMLLGAVAGALAEWQLDD